MREVSLASNTQIVQVFLSHAAIGCDFALDLASAGVRSISPAHNRPNICDSLVPI